MNHNQTIHSCIVCNSDQLTPIAGYEKAWLSRCSNCGMVFSTNNPSQAQLEEYYKGYGRNDYLSPITIKRYHEILDRFESARKTNKLLDVGCGIGYFLEVAKSRGWDVFGTEFTDAAIQICEAKGIKMKKGVLDPHSFESESFDIITSFEVIEHINTPQTEVSNFHKLLRKGGLLYITTPNFNSLLRYNLKSSYNVISWPEHLSYYTPSSLNKLMRDHHLRKVFIQATGISITRFVTSQKPAPNQTNTVEGTEFVAANTQDEVLRNRFEKNPLLGFSKSLINRILTLSGKGDALKGLFQKT